MQTVKPEGFQKAIQEMLAEIPQQVDNVIDEASAKVSKQAVQELKSTSPRGKGKKSGRYAKGWTSKKDGSATVIYNRTDYMLTHLLENGHDVISRGKKAGHVSGRSHIKPVEQKVIQDMTEEVEKGINKL